MALYEDVLYVTIDSDSHSFKSMLYLLSISDKGDINREIYLNNFVEEWRTVKSLTVDKDAVYVGIAPAALPCGATKSYEKNGENNSFIMKFDKRGNLIWKIGFYRVINGVALSKDGLLYATFSRYSVMNDKHCKTYALNQNGEILWSASLGAYIGAPVIGPDALYVYSEVVYMLSGKMCDKLRGCDDFGANSSVGRAAWNVMSAIEEAVICERYSDKDYHGISIFLPDEV